MKKNILFAAFLLIFLTYFSNAQLTVESKVSECLTQAETYAKNNGYTNPELVAIGSIAGDFDMNGIPLKFKIDIKTGKSTFWLFVLKSAAKPDSAAYIGVIKTMLGQFLTVPVAAEQISQFEVDLSTSLKGVNWMDSDKLYAYLSNNSDYTTYIKNNATATCTTLGLGSVQGGVFWVMMFQATGSQLTCLMNAVSGDLYCIEDITGIEDNFSASINVFPNPTSEMITVSLPIELQSNDSRMILTDYTGNIIKELNIPKNGEVTLTAFDTKDLSNGVYFVKYTSSKGNFVKSFNVVK